MKSMNQLLSHVQQRWMGVCAFVFLTCALAGCAVQQPIPQTTVTQYPAPEYAPVPSEWGWVHNVEVIRTEQRGQTSGGGALIGSIVGGIIGHQVGGGFGRDVATVAGVVGGAMVGNQLEGNQAQVSSFYRVSVRTDTGAMRTLDYAQPPQLRIGDRVELRGQQLIVR